MPTTSMQEIQMAVQNVSLDLTIMGKDWNMFSSRQPMGEEVKIDNEIRTHFLKILVRSIYQIDLKLQF